MENTRQIGEIGNYYGGLHIKIDGGRYYWGIEDWDGIAWQEIGFSLYRTLSQYQDESED